jgi:glycosyltransferase involved in cell wall biosynthesis/2-polyprenyl-3-methyl-5-hydroxy-6-metoxy-1,4-benzoquinol methylase
VQIREKCWCGNPDLEPFSDYYFRCPACETLISSRLQEKQTASEGAQADHFYGRDYWFTHQQEDLHQPNIIERARQDLPERCIHWLSAIIKYKLPPGRVLELGSGHGGFVALLCFSGFEATGVEVSPWAVEFARETFHAPMLLGPVEEQALEPGSLDMVILMDILEHLPDPERTMRHCLRLLKPNGIFVIQTPCLPEGKTYEEMKSRGDRFLEMLIEREHLYLFSRPSIQEFFRRLEINHLEFEPAIFSRYDMFLIAGREPLTTHPSAQIDEALNSSPSGRMVRALVDSYLQKRDLLEKYQEADADRAARLQTINRLSLQLREFEDDRAAHLETINRLSLQLRELEDARMAQVELHRLSRQLQETQSVLKALQGGRVFRILRRTGFWGGMENMIRGVLGPDPVEAGGNSHLFSDLSDFSPEGQFSRIAVDLTPLLPGAENGGAKLLALELVRHLSRLAPHCEFLLLTSPAGHDELSSLDSPNVRRICQGPPHAPAHPSPGMNRPESRQIPLREWLRAHLPAPLLARAKDMYYSWQMKPVSSSLLRQVDVQLLFCPFTMPFFYDPKIPVVSVVYDLQFAYYPQFFSSEDRAAREYHFRETCRRSSLLVCISDYVRETVLLNSGLPPARVVTIPIRLANRLQRPSAENISAVLQKYGLQENGFLLYPANFWLHKSHSMLLTAFGMYRHSHPESPLRLVLTGSPGERMNLLHEAVQRMGLQASITLPGYLSEVEFAPLLASCKALIFPSLYEGFGMPVLEAMAFSKPVLCSNVTSLPEVAGDGALLFDPRKPHEILAAIEQIMADPKLASSLIERGKARIDRWGCPEQMAREYLAIFRKAKRSGAPSSMLIYAGGIVTGEGNGKRGPGE